MDKKDIEETLNKAHDILVKKHGKEVVVKISKDLDSVFMFDIIFTSYAKTNTSGNPLGQEDINKMFGLNYIVGNMMKSKLINLFREEAKLTGKKLSEFVVTIHFNPNKIIGDNEIDISKYL